MIQIWLNCRCFNSYKPGFSQILSLKDVSNFFYLSAQPIASKPFAIISIELNNQNIVDKDRIMLKPVFTLQLEAKQTYWQYILNINQKFESLIIDSSVSAEEFDKTETVTSGNKPVITFTSKSEIPITETREDYFRLKLRNGDPANDLIIISKLPLPEIGVLNRNFEGKIYSPIYVNF